MSREPRWSLAVRSLLATPTSLLALVLLADGAQADESKLQLADDPARAQVQAICSACHSVDYIVMNSPFQDRAGWEKTVTKMIKVMGAPIESADAAVIVDYLDRHYGAARTSTP
jgi:cytochrome c5